MIFGAWLISKDRGDEEDEDGVFSLGQKSVVVGVCWWPAAKERGRRIGELGKMEMRW